MALSCTSASRASSSPDTCAHWSSSHVTHKRSHQLHGNDKEAQLHKMANGSECKTLHAKNATHAGRVAGRRMQLDDGGVDEQQAGQEEDDEGRCCAADEVQHRAQVRHLAANG